MILKINFKSFGVIIILILLIHNLAFAQLTKESNLTIDNGLVNNEVTAIHQDKYGFLWFGTRGGLNKYDGYDFDLIRYKQFSKKNLTNQAVEVIVEDKDHTLWIGTKSGGLNSYDILRDSVFHYNPPANVKIQEIKALTVSKTGVLYIGALYGLYTFHQNKFEIIDQKESVLSIYEAPNGEIYYGTSSGLFIYNPKFKKSTKVNLNIKTIITSITFNPINHVFYLGTWENGLLAYNYKTKSIKQYLTKGKNAIDGLSSKNTYRVFLDSNYQLWVGTWGGGLNKFNPITGEFTQINIKPIDVDNSDYHIILSIEEDASGIIWVGTDGGGICKIDAKKNNFKGTALKSSLQKSINNTHVVSVFKDDLNRIWLGPRGSGLSFSENNEDFISKDLTINAKVVQTFFVNNGKDLWVGHSFGLSILKDFYKQNNKPIHVNENINNPNNLSGPKVTAIVQDQNKIIWVGTQEHGLNRVIGFKNGIPFFKRYPDRFGVKGMLQNARVSCMLVDSKNRLWIGTYDGLHLYNRATDNFIVLKRENNRTNSLSNNTILSLAEDKNGNIWIGTQQGLNQLQTDKQQQFIINNYFETVGFPNDYIHAIQIDNHNNIWMSTNGGITKFDYQKNLFRNFDRRDGTTSNTFSENASFKSKDGMIYFGGITGLTYFHPDSIKLNKREPNVFITKLKINNNDISVGADEDQHILTNALFLTPKIDLNHRENIITLSFSALDYHASDKNHYRYKLDGFDKNWVNSGKRRNVTYTNLPSGTYTFFVQAANSDQTWNNKGASLKIVVFPPPWKTWWAYTIYMLIIGGILFWSRYNTLSKLNLKNKLEIADLNYKKEHEIAEIKSKLFANISHEFRTPLTLMIGPLDGLKDAKDTSEEVKGVINKVQNQTKRLLSLINQLLDFNKAEANALQLKANDFDLIILAKAIFDSFVDEAKRKNIKFSFISNKSELIAHVDKDKIESILYNLLSNAFKFTPKNGSIDFHVELLADQSSFLLSIKDSGTGISDEDKSKVFDRFYQVSQAEAGQYVGTGIGLAFVKDLVALHQGKINIEDNKPVGTIINITIPVGQIYKEIEAYLNQSTKEEVLAIDDDEIASNTIIESQDEELPIILVVEDNEELNHYICKTLEPVAKIISAFNGKEGFDLALKEIPDLVISDVMMPKMDGYQLCNEIKNDSKTSHIPVILLTAKVDDDSVIKGVKTGADSYLAKPFNPNILLTYALHLIDNRKKLKELFNQKMSLAPGEIEVNSSEQDFIEKAIKYIEDNINTDEMSIDDLASSLNMSRSTFYRKLKGVTGMSGIDFIKLIRIKRSAQLLKTGEYSVSSAAYASGFNDLKHFRKSFQSQFGIKPSEYLKQEKGIIE